MYQTKVEPYPHQLEALERLKGREAFALLMAMRTGKTKTLLDDFGRLELAGECNDLLVVAPAGVYKTWVGAFKDHASEDLFSRAQVFVWDSKTAKSAKVKQLREQFLDLKTAPRIALVNIESLSSVKEARAFCEKFLHDRSKSMIAIDESVIIKTPGARRTKYVNGTLRFKARWRRILSGLPTPRSPLDLFEQFNFLDPQMLGFKSYFSFRARYAIMQKMPFGGRNVQIVVGYRNVEELTAKIAPHSFRVPFVPDIPSTYVIRHVPLSNEQIRIYNEIKKFATAKIQDDAHVTATVVIAQILRMHQVLCGHVVDELGQLHEIPEHKTDELLELLQEFAGKAIIWCSYDFNIKHVAAALTKEYGPGSVARFWGGNRDTREAEEALFLDASSACRFMVATPAAGGRGRTWSNADLVIYFSSTNDLEHREQSEQRVHGVGKKRGVGYVDLIAPDSVEMKIVHALRKKIDMAATINGDNWREWLI
jgi:hypothetical protein